MGTEDDMIRKMKMRQLHVIALGIQGITKIIPELSVIGLPFLFDWEPELFYNMKHCGLDYVLEKLEPSVARVYEKGGIQLLTISGGTFATIGTKVPLKTARDLEKIKFFAFGGDRIMQETNHKVFGARKSVNITLYEFLPMLSTGTIDSVILAWYPVGLGLQAWPYIKYAPSFSYYYLSGNIIMDKRAFNRVVAFADKWGSLWGMKDGRDFAVRYLEAWDVWGTKIRFPLRGLEGRAREVLTKRGIKLVHFSEEEVDKLKEKAESLHDELAGKYYPRWLLDEILKYRDEYRKLKSEGKLDEFRETGIVPGGDQRDEWRTQWGKEFDER